MAPAARQDVPDRPEQGRIIDDAEIKLQLANSRPYRQWIERLQIKLESLPAPRQAHVATQSSVSLLDRQQAFGWTQEDYKFILEPMATTGEEVIGSMGNDAPLAVLSDRAKPFYNYFRQLFAQVTNPPIDPIREQLVMSLVSFIGPKPNLLDINNVNPPLRRKCRSRCWTSPPWRRSATSSRSRARSSAAMSWTSPIRPPGAEGIEARVAALCARAVDAVQSGYNILIVSDRRSTASAWPSPRCWRPRPCTST